MKRDAETILIADDDRDVLSFVEINLELEGYNVVPARNGERALELVRELRPDLVLLDVMMPGIDGFQVCRAIREDPRTRHVPVIMLTAKALSADKIVGLTAGADDYIIKPFDPMELTARVRTTLRRSHELRATNPLTHLPGNDQIKDEVERRIASGDHFAVLYVDLDHFKAFNDHYGFSRGDEAIKILASNIAKAAWAGSAASFAGHIGGDDFIVVAPVEAAETIAAQVVEEWDAAAPALYDPADRDRGYIEIADRRGENRQYPIATVSIGIVTNLYQPIASYHEASDLAADMKKVAKATAGSYFEVDRRGEKS